MIDELNRATVADGLERLFALEISAYCFINMYLKGGLLSQDIYLRDLCRLCVDSFLDYEDDVIDFPPDSEVIDTIAHLRMSAGSREQVFESPESRATDKAMDTNPLRLPPPGTVTRKPPKTRLWIVIGIPLFMLCWVFAYELLIRDVSSGREFLILDATAIAPVEKAWCIWIHERADWERPDWERPDWEKWSGLCVPENSMVATSETHFRYEVPVVRVKSPVLGRNAFTTRVPDYVIVTQKDANCYEVYRVPIGLRVFTFNVLPSDEIYETSCSAE